MNIFSKLFSWMRKPEPTKSPVPTSTTSSAQHLVTAINSSNANEKYMVDFRTGRAIGGWASGGVNFNSGSILSGSNIFDVADGESEGEKATKPAPIEEKTEKVVIRPKDVLVELERVPTPFSVEALEQKISMLEDKRKLVRDSNEAVRELNDALERLEARKKYEEHRTFFERWQNTTDSAIETLLEKYSHLGMGTADLFIPDFPDAAVNAMKEYDAECEKVCGKKPVYYVIAMKKDLRIQEAKRGKRDPILLVQSPFGFYWQILGAWDEEMVLLREL